MKRYAFKENKYNSREFMEKYTKSKAHEKALEIKNVFWGQYEDYYSDEVIWALSEEEALNFVVNHIDDMVAINGVEELWGVELEAIQDFNLYERYNLTKKEVIDRLRKYEGFPLDKEAKMQTISDTFDKEVSGIVYYVEYVVVVSESGRDDRILDMSVESDISQVDEDIEDMVEDWIWEDVYKKINL